MVKRILDFRERVFLTWNNEHPVSCEDAARMADEAALALYREETNALFYVLDGRLSLKVW